jgi:hypothetical protein
MVKVIVGIEIRREYLALRGTSSSYVFHGGGHMEAITSLKDLDVLFISLGGILCIYLGYRLMVLGTNRPFKLFSDLKGWKARSANLAPGVFFAILGSLVLCSSVITNVISILQKEAFINTYATKLILDELRKKNEEILSSKLEDHVSLKRTGDEISPSTNNLAQTELRELDKVVVMSNELRLRKNPGTNHQIVDSLQKGTVIIVKETRGQWLRVTTDDVADGWVHGNYVKRLEGFGPDGSTETALNLSSDS